jgi:hypothetical protein
MGKTSDDLAVTWAAGFLEGEGYFVLEPMPSGNMRYRLGANQVNIDPLLRLADIFEAGRIYERKQTARQNWWGWQVYGEEACLEITGLIWPWLTADRQERIPWGRYVTTPERATT